MTDTAKSTESRVTARTDPKTKAKLGKLVEKLRHQYPALKINESTIVNLGLDLIMPRLDSGKLRPFNKAA